MAVKSAKGYWLDIESVVSAAIAVYRGPASAWRTAGLAGKQALRSFLFPQGVSYAKGVC